MSDKEPTSVRHVSSNHVASSMVLQSCAVHVILSDVECSGWTAVEGVWRFPPDSLSS